MNDSRFVAPDTIRSLFSCAMSEMYRLEVPQYGALIDIVAETNRQVMNSDKALAARLRSTGEIDRLNAERHGAIRLGTAQELAWMRRLFAIMGMKAVGYYDLSAAGVPVHATAFRCVDSGSLRRSPFRIFTSLLRLELIADYSLRQFAAEILAKRTVMTKRCAELIQQYETVGGLTEIQSREFVAEALITFKWHKSATVGVDAYRQLRDAHPLIADVTCFRGPHINHLTPRVLDIDLAQAAMRRRGLKTKDSVEGPPRRQYPILLRQTSFLALKERIAFLEPAPVSGTHTARFGEVEQRGCALTPKGRSLYDRLVAETQEEVSTFPAEFTVDNYNSALSHHFLCFPDNQHALWKEQLIYVKYQLNRETLKSAELPLANNIRALVETGVITYEPLTYEDFLPVSAAGIFRSNLGVTRRAVYQSSPDQSSFERALGAPVLNEFDLYADIERNSLAQCLRTLGAKHGEVLTG